MPCVRQHISLCLCVSDKILAHDSLLREYLHGIVSLAFDLLHEKDLAKASFSQKLYRYEALHVYLLVDMVRIARDLHTT